MLPHRLRYEIVEALLAIPGMNSRTRRDALLGGLPPGPVRALNRDENDTTDFELIVDQLDRLGVLLESGERPLVILVQNAFPRVEGTEPGRRLQAVTKALIEHYGSREAAVAVPATLAQPPGMVATRLPEAILLGDQRVGFSFIRRALDAAASVARLSVTGPRGQVCGTGWMIGPGLLITNHHFVAARTRDSDPLPSAEQLTALAAGVRVWFDYHVEGGSKDERSVTGLVCYDVDLDFALLRIAAPDRLPLTLARQRPHLQKGDRLNIVQHPRGGPLQLAIRGNHYVGPGDRDSALRYLTDTEGGSSGSPVLDDTWRVVGLHHAAVPVPPQVYDGRTVYFNNEGIALHTILGALPVEVAQAIAAAQPS